MEQTTEQKQPARGLKSQTEQPQFTTKPKN